MDEGFTQKEMLIRILDKLEKIEAKAVSTHEMAKETNGKVKLHTKLIFALGGIIVSVVGFLLSHIMVSAE